MMRCLASLLLLLALTSAASAQCQLGPQDIAPPAVTAGIDQNCALYGRLIGPNEIVSPFPFSTSIASDPGIMLGFGQVKLNLDNGNGFAVNQTVQVWYDADPEAYVIGVIVAYDPGFSTATINVTVPNLAAPIIIGVLDVQVLSGSALNGVPSWAGLSVDGNTVLTNPATQGTVVNLTVEPGKTFTNFSTVYVWAPQDITTWLVGVVISYNPSSGAIAIFTTQTPNTGLTYSTNFVSLIGTGGPAPALTGYASTPLTIGAGVFDFTIQPNQFFPTDGQVLMTCIDVANPTSFMAGQVVAYNGTALRTRVTANGVFGSGSCSAWSIYLTTGPTTRIPYYSINGLQVMQLLADAGSPRFTIRPGSVRDFTDNVDLVLDSDLSIDLSSLGTVVAPAQTGTITSAGANITGSGTSFSSVYNIGSADGILTDLQLQYQQINGAFFTYFAMIGVSGAATSVASVTDNTHLSTYENLGVTGSAYARCGVVSTLNTAAYASYFIVLARADADGSLAVFASCVTPTGAPDLPAGYTDYRVIGAVLIAWVGSNYGIFVVQPLQRVPIADQGEMEFFDAFQTYTRLTIGNLGDVLQVGTSPSGVGLAPTWGPAKPAIYKADGTLISSPHAVSDQATLSGGTKTVTLSGAAAFASANSYIVVATDATGINAVKAANISGSQFVLSGTGTDKISFIAMSAVITPTGGCTGTIDLSSGCAQGPLGGL